MKAPRTSVAIIGKPAATTAKGLVVRRNELIHARYRMTLQEQRLLLWLIAQIQRDDVEFKTFRVGAKELARAIGIDGGNNFYERLAHTTELLMTRVAKVPRVGENTLTQIQFLSKTKYYFGDGVVELCLNEHMRPFLLELKEKFNALELQHAIRLSSFYAVRIYEILMCESFRGSVYEITLPDLRERLGIEDGKLARTDHFKAKVLDIAEREINANTDLRYSSAWIKTGRDVSGVRFTMTKRASPPASPAASASSAGNASSQPDVLRALQGLGMTPREAQALIAKWAGDPDRIAWHLRELKRLRDAGRIATPIAWLRAAIDRDYRRDAAARKVDALDREREQRLRAGLDRPRGGASLSSVGALLHQRRA